MDINSDTSPHFGLGVQLYEAGNFRESLRELELALATNESPVASIHYYRASIYDHMGESRAAVTELRLALSQIRESFELTYALGRALMKIASYVEAEHALREAARLCDSDPGPWAHIALLYLHKYWLGQRDEQALQYAGAILDWAIQRWPDSASLLFRKAEWALQHRETWPVAIKALEDLLLIDPADVRAYVRLYSLYFRMGHWGRFLRLARREYTALKSPVDRAKMERK